MPSRWDRFRAWYAENQERGRALDQQFDDWLGLAVVAVVALALAAAAGIVGLAVLKWAWGYLTH